MFNKIKEIKEFMEDNWSEVIITAASVVGQVVICFMYKGYLKRSEG